MWLILTQRLLALIQQLCVALPAMPAYGDLYSSQELRPDSSPLTPGTFDDLNPDARILTIYQRTKK